VIVALDITPLRQSSGGIARYIRGLVSGLTAIRGLEVVQIGGGDAPRRGTFAKKLLTAQLDLSWYPLRARAAARRSGADVIHFPSPKAPLRRGVPPAVVTIHDLIPFHFPETMTTWSRAYARLTHRRMVGCAARVICNSTDTAADAIKYLGVAPDLIRVIPLGIDPLFFESAQGIAGARDPYILFVGTRELRKNLGRLEDAVGELRARGYPHSLVVAGGEAWGKVEFRSTFVRLVGPVSDITLRDLYAGAACLAIPSLHEGFGLPALEAMAVGTPVVAGRAGALPEVTGGAAILVDPLDTNDIMRGIERAINAGDAFRVLGKARAAAFTWERTANMTLEAYADVAEAS
jgi:glycosyltransferase involved in cell wall biosynthesis